jgi:hypothetical protein
MGQTLSEPVVDKVRFLDAAPHPAPLRPHLCLHLPPSLLALLERRLAASVASANTPV